MSVPVTECPACHRPMMGAITMPDGSAGCIHCTLDAIAAWLKTSQEDICKRLGV